MKKTLPTGQEAKFLLHERLDVVIESGRNQSSCEYITNR